MEDEKNKISEEEVAATEGCEIKPIPTVNIGHSPAKKSEKATVIMEPAERSPSTIKSGYALMNFYDALKRVAVGEKISREEWKNKDINLSLNNEILSIRKDDGVLAPLIVQTGDIVGIDWFVVK